MRFYSFTNYYLSSIQLGIQSAHALGEMFNRYPFGDSPVGRTLREWSANHKTMVLLNGGNSAALRDLWTLLSDPRNTKYPVSKFSEDEASLDGALTCVAIILPESLYEAKWMAPGTAGNENGYWWYNIAAGVSGHQILGWEAELLTVLKRLPLAK